MTHKDLNVDGLSGQELADFILMLENNSSLESIQDDFGWGHARTKSMSERVRIEARKVGGLNLLRDIVEPKSSQPTQSPFSAPQTATPKSKSYADQDEIKRTSIGLRDALFVSMQDLRAGRMDVKDAMGMCGLMYQTHQQK